MINEKEPNERGPPLLNGFISRRAELRSQSMQLPREQKNDGLNTHTHTHRRNIRITLSVFHLWQKKFKVGKEPHLAPLAVKMTFCNHRNSTMKTRESMSGWTKGEKEKKKTLKKGDCPCHIYTDEEQKQLFILKLINICECVENRREHTHTQKRRSVRKMCPVSEVFPFPRHEKRKISLWGKQEML